MTPRQAAEYIGITPQQVRTLIRSGVMKAKRMKTTSNRHGYEYIITKPEAKKFRDRYDGRRTRHQ